MSHIFISHASADDPFVADLRRALEAHGLTVWVDSRNLRGGNRLLAEIKAAIESARHFIAVLSLQTVNSPWVRLEINHALKIARQRGADFRIIPLLLPGMTPAALAAWFGDEPVALKVELSTIGVSEALPALLAALGERLPSDPTPPSLVETQPVEELILELSQPQMTEHDGKRRARATARLLYHPADPAQRPIESKSYFFSAPLGPIELDELRWYFEEYHRWPVGVFAQRAATTEAALPQWGKALFTTALGSSAAAAALNGWSNAVSNSSASTTRRVSIKVERELPEGAEIDQQNEADEAASQLLALPWELLHDGDGSNNSGGYFLHGRHATRIRRQLPNRTPQSRQLATLPVRVLLISPRPLKDERDNPVGYFDHRSSALPLVEAVENLGELVTLTVLSPPTLAALEAELQRAASAHQPYAVIHFDGHGIYDKRQGLGALCFERANSPVLDLVYARDLAAIVRNYGIPLVFLDACQSAEVESDPSASVAAALLQEGVTSVVAMRHSVLVETARRFVEAFYTALATGKPVGEATLHGQQQLKADSYRGKMLGAGELRLHDWFVPVLLQDQPDPQLFNRLPSQDATRLLERRRKLALGDLPATPAHTFVRRSQELLHLERLLTTAQYAVIRGTGGAGKTTIAVELARWLLRSGRTKRVAFVSLEDRRDERAVLDTLGRQLLPDGDTYSVAQYPDLKQALQPVERALADQPTVIVLDNVESILDLEFSILDSAAPDEPQSAIGNPQSAIFTLCQTLLSASPTTRLLFTSRERLPPPFDSGRFMIELGALRREEAVALVEHVLANEGWTPPASDTGDTPEAVSELVEAVGCHARALVLLAREVARQGVRATTATVQRLMSELERKHPGQRENSLFASVELSLQRLPTEVREKLSALAVFHSGGHVVNLAKVMEVEIDIARAIALALIDVGLASDMGYGYLRFDPALSPYLLHGFPIDAVNLWRTRWAEAIIEFIYFLHEQIFKDTKVAFQLTLLDLHNFVALLKWLPQFTSLEKTIATASMIEKLVMKLNQPMIMNYAIELREAATKQLESGNHYQFQSDAQSIEQLLQANDLPTANKAVQKLHQRTLATGENAYDEAPYDIALSFILLSKVLHASGQAYEALAPLTEGKRRLEALIATGDSKYTRMIPLTYELQGQCLRELGNLEMAAQAFQKGAEIALKISDYREVAVNKGELGTVRFLQNRLDEALEASKETLSIFEQLSEPASVALAWHRMGMIYRVAGNTEAAEGALRQGLRLRVQYSLRSDEASSLVELGNLYNQNGRLVDAVDFYRQALEIDLALRDHFNESKTRSNLSNTLTKLKHYDEARLEIRCAIECDKHFGHAAETWKTWSILHDIEIAGGDAVAAQSAWQQAYTSYLAYRRAGGYVQADGGQLIEQLLAARQAGQSAEVQQALSHFSQAANTPGEKRPLLSKLQAIFAGSRDPALADDPALDYDDAAELLLLIERLG